LESAVEISPEGILVILVGVADRRVRRADMEQAALDARGHAQDARGDWVSRDKFRAEALGKPYHGAIGAVLCRANSVDVVVERLHASTAGQAALLHAHDVSACGGELSIEFHNSGGHAATP